MNEDDDADREGGDVWADAHWAATLLAIDPRGLGGVWIRAGAGPLRERFLVQALDLLPSGVPRRRMAAATEEPRLVGGLDFAATLSAGRPVMETGILAGVDGGALVLAMAERVPARSAALIAGAMDRGAIRAEREGFSAELPARFVMFALDEGGEDEALPARLADRLAFRVELDGGSLADLERPAPARERVEAARAKLLRVEMPDALAQASSALAAAAGGVSARADLFIARAARAAAAWRGGGEVTVDDIALAARLVLGAARLAEALEQARPAEPEPTAAEPPSDEPAADSEGALRDRVLEAVAASLPSGLLDRIRVSAAGRGPRHGSGAGAPAASGRRGRPTGTTARPPFPGARLDLVATLRTAAPWQRVRGADPAASPDRLRITADDFRYLRRKEKRGSTAIFAVDASGSAAVARLAEAKGAIELLLAECYVRRDQVALVAYRKAQAEILLEPTRALVRAKRALAGLPGGGGTPLAHGIVAASQLAATLKRKGQDTISVFLTDGRGNIALDGTPGRDRAMADARSAALRFRAAGYRALVIDTAARPQPDLGRLAADLGADYLPLPRGGAARISRALTERLAG